MLIRNRSAYDTQNLRRLTSFVLGCCTDVEDAGILVVNHPDPKFTVGCAYQQAPPPHKIEGAKALVVVWATPIREYPKVTYYIKEVGPILVNSWDEEYVLTLAHEMRHIGQFNRGSYDGSTPSGVHAAEIDAEMFGLQTLRTYQKYQKVLALQEILAAAMIDIQDPPRYSAV